MQSGYKNTRAAPALLLRNNPGLFFSDDVPVNVHGGGGAVFRCESGRNYALRRRHHGGANGRRRRTDGKGREEVSLGSEMARTRLRSQNARGAEPNEEGSHYLGRYRQSQMYINI
ncbi:hypothetical protein EYF80_058527 [Liparis tanakae]|uniref:Uncharacterized protein n=1 Tax=Liparis tanakae TaxID=230148 RepID=A0A4Z2ERV9_9TELE|nr:hypothetical protein EYF80_058527 [Liparis tanakae]